MLADSQGQLVQPTRGPLNLSWLFRVSPESARQARERLISGPVRLDTETLVGWFCLAMPADRAAVEELEGKAWRKSLKIWKARPDDRAALHNRATLHRLMYLSPEAENPGGHIRKAYELYHRLDTEVPGRYGLYVEWANFELERSIYAADGDKDDEMVARSLQLIAATRGVGCCEEIQEDLMLEEVDDLALHCATLVRELLPYQGVTTRPPKGMLERVVEETELELLPPAVRLAYRLVPESRQRRRVDSMVAELCGLLSQTLFKAGDGRQGKKWQTEAERWEAQVAAQWEEPEAEHLGDEEAATVAFSETQVVVLDTGPRSQGPSWFGVHGKLSRGERDDPREEWLEAFRIVGIPVFPLRRFVIYRNFDTGETGRVERLQLSAFHHFWQATVVVGLTFALTLGFIRAPGHVASSRPASSASPTVDTAELDKALDRLQYLAQLEAKLKNAPKPDTKRLKAIATEREALIDKIQRLENPR